MIQHNEPQCGSCGHLMARGDKRCANCGTLSIQTQFRYIQMHGLREANVSRCSEVFHPFDEWTIFDWALAVAGEAGELANLIKKVRRGDFTMESAKQAIADELADVVIYCDLAAASLGIDLGRAVARKFNEVSDRTGSIWKIKAKALKNIV